MGLLTPYRITIKASFCCQGKGKIWKMIFFQDREKSGIFVVGQENLERTSKVRELEN